MTRISRASIQAFRAFGNASIAICGVNELARSRQASARAGELLVELRAAHVQLRALFADGLDDAVCALAGDVMELASVTTECSIRTRDHQAVDQGQAPFSYGCAVHAGGTACGARRRIAPMSG